MAERRWRAAAAAGTATDRAKAAAARALLSSSRGKKYSCKPRGSDVVGEREGMNRQPDGR